jgi:hypothetical protein
VSNQVYAGGSAYLPLTRLATSEVGLLFEADNYTRIDLVHRSVSQISGGSDPLFALCHMGGGRPSLAQPCRWR